METPGTQEQLLQNVRQLAAEVAVLKAEGADSLTENLAQWLAAQFVVAAKTAAAGAEGGCVDLKTLRALCADVVALRRGDHYAGRLKLERERLELERRQVQERTEAFCLEWAGKPENRSKICPPTLSPAERERRIREIYGLPEPKGGISAETLAKIEGELKLL